jgi:MSHA biogenesis protein MshP
LRSGSCIGASGSLDLRATAGFLVTVTCTAKLFNEGETAPGTALPITTYSIEAVACNSAVCPDIASAPTPGYVERKRLVIANTP